MKSVLQDWVQELPLMQQSVLLTAIRGPDGVEKYHPVKSLMRWYRRCVLISAFDRQVLIDPLDPRGGSFTGPIQLDSLEEVVAEHFRNIDRLPHHFVCHMTHAAEIVGYNHPLTEIADWWLSFYQDCCKDMHMHPESREELFARLGDNKQNWITAGIPYTIG